MDARAKFEVAWDLSVKGSPALSKGTSTRCIFLRPLSADFLSILLVFFVVPSNIGGKWVIWVGSAQ